MRIRKINLFRKKFSLVKLSFPKKGCVEICVILWLILLVGIGAASAEGPTWTAKPGWDLPDDVGKGAAPAFVDIDDDGDYDLFIGEQFGVSFAYENTGSASSPIWTAKPGWNLPDVGMGSKPAFADLDDDGDYDLLIGEGPHGATYAYENTGSASSANWTVKPGWNPPTLEWMGAKPALADLDSDGDYDLLLYEAYTGNSSAYENTGSASSPIWTAKPGWNPPYAGGGATPALADLDSDGDYDLLVGNKTGATSAYENTGGASSPAWTRKSDWDPPDVAELAAKPALADLDGDGDYDLMIGTMEGVSLGYENIAPYFDISISTDKYEYAPGDTMTSTIDISNPFEDSLTFQWYWGIPQYSIWVSVMSAPIPAGYNDTRDFSFTIPDWGSTPFGNVFYVQLLNADGEVLDADAACWAYSPGGEAMPAEEVDAAKEIKKTIEKMEFCYPIGWSHI